MKLRDYQEECLRSLLGLQERDKGAAVLPPGSGKTVLMGAYCDQLRDKKILIVVNRDELVEQTVDKLQSFGIQSLIEKADSHASPAAIKDLQLKMSNYVEYSRKEIIDAIDDKYLKIRQRAESQITLSRQRIEDAVKHNRPIQRKYELDFSIYKQELAEYESRQNRAEKKYEIARREYQDKLKARREWRKNNKRKNYPPGLGLGDFYAPKKEVIGDKPSAPKLELSPTRRFEKSIEVNTYKLQTLESDKFRELQYRLDELERTKTLRKKVETPSRVIVASVQSLHEKRIDNWDRDFFDVVIFDEAHHLTAPSWRQVELHFYRATKIAFSATLDPKEIKYNLAYSIDIVTLMEKGWLVRPKHTKIDLRKDDITYGSDRYLSVLEDLLIQNKDRKTICFCSSVDEVHALGSRLAARGIKTAAVSSRLSNNDRRRLISDFRKDKIKVLLNYMIVYEGFDDPGSELIIAKNTSNKKIYIQAVGRGLRPDKNKNTVEIIDLITTPVQKTLPTLFGLHDDWEFEGDPLEDFIWAKRFAEENDLVLDKYPTREFLKSKKTPEQFGVVSGTKRRRSKTNYKKVFGDELKMVGYGKNGATAVAYGGSKFYSPTTTLNQMVKESLQKELSFQPVKQIDPKTVTTSLPDSNSLSHKRLIAASFLRKYSSVNGFLSKMGRAARYRPLSEGQCDAVIRICRELREREKELET